MNKEFIRREKEAKARQAIADQKEREINSLKESCKNLEELIKDAKYKGYKYMLEVMLVTKRNIRENLRFTTKTNEEYLRQALILDTEISLLKAIVEIPETFKKQLEYMTGGKKNENV